MKTCTVASAFVLALSQLHLASGAITSFNATFDTLVVLPDEGRLSPVGIYMGFSFADFDLAQPDIQLAGLIPESEPNFAFATGAGAMTVSYPGSTVKSFALTSLNYGCKADLGQGLVSPPVSCTIKATGYGAGSSTPVVNQDFDFSPAAGLVVPMDFGRFEAGFTGLENVTYAVETPATGVNMYLDNIVGFQAT